MSGLCMTWARQQTTGNSTAKSVLLLLGELVSDEGTTTRSQTEIAQILECNRATIGRALTLLESRGLIKRERRQASDTKRLPDRITLMVQASFTATVPNAPDPEEETEHPTGEGSNFERSESEPREGSNFEQREGSNFDQLKDNYPPNPGITLSGGTEVELPGMPAKTELVKAEPTPEAKIAKWAYDKTNGGLKYQAMQNLGRDAVRAGYAPGDVAKAMVAMFQAGRNVNQQSLAQYLQGIIRPNGTVPRPSTTDQRVMDALALKERVRARQAAQ